MEKAYFDRLRKMKLFCLCEAILSWCFCVFFIAAIAFGAIRNWLLCIASVAFIVITLVLLAWYNSKMHYMEYFSPYVLTLSMPLSKENIFEKLSTQPNVKNSKNYSENEAVFFFRKKLRVRVLAVYFSDFSKLEFDRAKRRLNRKINKDFAIKHELSRSEEIKAVRVNFILSENINAELYGFLNRNATETMRRIEGVLNIAVDLTHGKLYIPVMFGDCIFSNVRKYERCVKEICSLSGIDYFQNKTE